MMFSMEKIIKYLHPITPVFIKYIFDLWESKYVPVTKPKYKNIYCFKVVRKKMKILIIDNFFSYHLMVIKPRTVIELGNA